MVAVPATDVLPYFCVTFNIKLPPPGVPEKLFFSRIKSDPNTFTVSLNVVFPLKWLDSVPVVAIPPFTTTS